MKWFKYWIQAIVMLSDIVIILAVVGVFVYLPSPTNIILGMVSILMIRNCHKGKNGMSLFYSWKRDSREKFFNRWDNLCNGKIHTEIRNG